MDLKEASYMFLSESTPYAELRSVAQAAYEDFSAGREVPYVALKGMFVEASRKGVLGKLKKRYGYDTFCDMVIVLGRETDRQRTIAGKAPVRSR
ncbi:hypothetical protein OG417_46500 [Actinoallomurus sp. NBC_01490]|uniref:hypothetical protein n=1 Tax=Actinoallomurus sp. NBC_01490 TaxID=2903557 RepID=UPI002E3723E0|nr:hypothetical protein [Actinoallomurus sp. NBC_01490]